MTNNKPHIIALGSAACRLANQMKASKLNAQFIFIDDEVSKDLIEHSFTGFRYIASSEVNKLVKFSVSDIPDLDSDFSNITHPIIITCLGGYTGSMLLHNLCWYYNSRNVCCSVIASLPFSTEGSTKRNWSNKLLKEFEYSNQIFKVDYDHIRNIYGNLTLEKAFLKADYELCKMVKKVLVSNSFNSSNISLN